MSEEQNLIRLLCRGLSRLAIAAQGIDRRLDEMLSDLRQMLRREIDEPQRLSALIDAIDAQIKVVDDERDQRSTLLQSAVQSLVEQLLAARPGADVVRELKALQKDFKQKFADGEELELLARLPALQAQVLDHAADGVPRGGLLSRWFGRDEAPSNGAVRNEDVHESAAAQPTAPEAHLPTAVRESVATPLLAAPRPDDEPQEGEPPFARIATAVCQVLDHLLQQIEPPPTATDNYRHARAQIAKGLNWYELVSTLEEIGVIVLAALERGQGEFQEFLLGISKRLEAAQQVIEASRANQTQRRRDDDVLNQTVRSEVRQMQAQVEAATQLDAMKLAVATRLDAIVGALDQHHAASGQRQLELEQQLGVLIERLSEMETQSAAIEARMLEQQRLALIDSLTQLPNRTAYEQRVAEESERWRRYGRPLTLAVCDADHFKLINDQFGHLAGDKVLRIIAKTLRQRLRKSDFIARFGGEEFVILLPETDCEEAQRALETLRDAVSQCPFHFRDKPVAVTVSIGIAEFTAEATPESVFERADAALYRAKEAGRNRCIVAVD